LALDYRFSWLLVILILGPQYRGRFLTFFSLGFTVFFPSLTEPLHIDYAAHSPPSPIFVDQLFVKAQSKVHPENTYFDFEMTQPLELGHQGIAEVIG